MPIIWWLLFYQTRIHGVQGEGGHTTIIKNYNKEISKIFVFLAIPDKQGCFHGHRLKLWRHYFHGTGRDGMWSCTMASRQILDQIPIEFFWIILLAAHTTCFILLAASTTFKVEVPAVTNCCIFRPSTSILIIPMFPNSSLCSYSLWWLSGQSRANLFWPSRWSLPFKLDRRQSGVNRIPVVIVQGHSMLAE